MPYYKTTKRRFKNPGKYRADTILVFSTTTYKHALPINLQLRKKNQSMCHLHPKQEFFFGESTKKRGISSDSHHQQQHKCNEFCSYPP